MKRKARLFRMGSQLNIKDKMNISEKPTPRMRIVGRGKWKSMSKVQRVSILIMIPVLLVLISGGSVAWVNYSTQYHTDLSLASQGMSELQDAENLLKISPNNPLDTQSVAKAQQKFSQANQTFMSLNASLQSLPGIASHLPVYGSRVQAALHVMPIAIAISQLGITGCSVLMVLVEKLRNPLSSQVQGQGLTSADLTQINKDAEQINSQFAFLESQINHLQPGDMQADPRIAKGINTFRKDLPQFQSWLQTMNTLLPIVPVFLGTDKPTNYLLEILDSTELRPGGGFVGNYGILTVSGGQMKSISVTDIDLLDKPFEAAGKYFPYPQQYSWFDIGSHSWSMRDSNLDPDFPTDARYGEMAYQTEAGPNAIPVQGVIAITPWLIQNLLKITGPIAVPEYQETVTAASLIDLIHFHQLGGKAAGEQSGTTQSPDGQSSLRKHFMALLADGLLGRVRQLASTRLSTLLKLGTDSLHTKDIQIYFNDNTAEAFLHKMQFDDTVLSPGGDTMMVVDANIAANKANTFITYMMDDQVTIDSQGNAVHRLTLRYGWTLPGNIYSRNTLYRDYMRVYAPLGSSLQTQTGWEDRGTGTAFNHEVWAGYFTLTFGQTRTIMFTWSVPHAATKDAQGWHYSDLVQRQAGDTWTLNLQVILPSCATNSHTSGGLVVKSGRPIEFSGSLHENRSFGVDYTC